jgi:ribosome-binding ATPase YchF (GTP1/OBG family)
MIIGFTGLDLPEGKTKYDDPNLEALIQKDNPKKVSPYYAELVKDEFIQSEVIVLPKDKILDLLIYDIEKIENRIARTTDDQEKQVLQKCLHTLDNELPLCEDTFTDEETSFLKALAPPSYKPVLMLDKPAVSINDIIRQALDKANYMFFYTSGPTESHAWLIKKNSDIVTCAAKIHSDLARGFIKGDVVSLEDYLNHHNFHDCKSKGVARVVDKDYIVKPNEIIEIRFNV